MKIVKFTALIVLLFVTCTKDDNTNKQLSSHISNHAALRKDTVKIPLNDLGMGKFYDSMGGLYPGGSNIPPDDYALDVKKACKNILPIDTSGNASTTGGKIVFCSLGGSTGGHNMKALIAKTNGNPLCNPYLKMFTCNNGTGDASLNEIMNSRSTYWNHVTRVIYGSKSSYKQVQVIYLETEDSTTYINFPGRPNLVKSELESCLRVFKQKFQNIKLVYVLGRTRTFGSKAIWNREPSPYYMGWGCKWAIRDQINKAPGTEYEGQHAVAPLLTWGFYQWADSLPRKTDNFYWRFTETADGLHANEEGQDTLSTRFQKFLLTDKFASIWYAAH